jgi:hypothetical protein
LFDLAKKKNEWIPADIICLFVPVICCPKGQEVTMYENESSNAIRLLEASKIERLKGYSPALWGFSTCVKVKFVAVEASKND